MRGIVNVIISVVLIGIIVAALLFLINTSLQSSLDTSEFETIKSQFEDCNRKIMETARTGSTNRCSLSAEKGEVVVGGDTILYKIVTNANICNESGWVKINENLWQICTVYGGSRLYQLKWDSPEILFQSLTGRPFGKLTGIEVRKVRDIKIVSEGKEISGTLLDVRRY